MADRPLPPELLALVAARFRVLSDPVRLQILQLLREEERSVGMLVQDLGFSQPNVSKHLRTLQDAGLIGRRQEGTTAWYSLADPSVFQLCDLVCSSIDERLATQSRLIQSATGRRRRR